MALTVNTNISSLVAQHNLSKATISLNQAIERMTTGSKINRAADNAAGYSIAKNWEVKLSSLDIAADNAATGSDLLSTLEDNCSLIQSHLQRVKDLTEQAANGTYGTSSRNAIESEITARLDEIDRIAKNCEFNDIYLLKGDTTLTTNGLTFQVGLDGTSDSKITVDKTVFKSATSAALLGDSTNADTYIGADKEAIADACSGSNASAQLTKLSKAIEAISTRITKIGAAGNRIDSAIESISVQSENITSSLSTLRDADIASESSRYIQAQILQQAASTLLSTANQTPSIALNLL